MAGSSPASSLSRLKCACLGDAAHPEDSSNLRHSAGSCLTRASASARMRAMALSACAMLRLSCCRTQAGAAEEMLDACRRLRRLVRSAINLPIWRASPVQARSAAARGRTASEDCTQPEPQHPHGRSSPPERLGEAPGLLRVQHRKLNPGGRIQRQPHPSASSGQASE
jgi:hypothetical protein